MIGLVDGNNFFVSCERVFNRRLVGRPVAVLSNNDGCCIARSNEFKALGISMGTPYFQLKHREKTGELSFCSSNYELYGDMSNRIISILREEAVDVEQYSIDEAFIVPPNLAERGNRERGKREQGIGNRSEAIPSSPYLDYGRRLRSKILRWVGIPCGVGFAPTKTLAKIANHIGKKRPEGVFLLPDDPSEILSQLPCDEVWGVGRRLAPKLRAERILSAQHLRDAADDVLRSLGGVTLLRVAMELRGISCHEERDCEADPDSISCSRSFGEPATTKEALAESLASFTAQAAAKLRRHGLLAAGCNVYAQIFAEGGGISPERSEPRKRSLEGCDCVGRTVVFPAPTDATNEILRAISDEVKYLYLPGVRYRKTGIVFFGLEKPGTAHQLDLFADSSTPAPRQSALYKAVDALNAKYGKGKVFSAAEGIGKKSWHMKRQKLTPRPTTRWDELIVVR